MTDRNNSALATELAEAVAVPDDMPESGRLERGWREIQRLGLEQYVAYLDVHGYAVIPPALATPNGLRQRLLEAVLDVAERRRGRRPDIGGMRERLDHEGRFGHYGAEGDSPFGDYLLCLIHEGRVFEEALMNPVVLALATYLCGYSVVLSSMGCMMKGPNESTLGLHADLSIPSPFPPNALACNATYILNDYDRDNGATVFVPGSHRLCRAPEPLEAVVGGRNGNPQAVPIEAPAGSVIFWHGNTWHGAYNRRAPGLRVSIPVYFSRPYMRTEEHLMDTITEEMLARNPARFAILTQQAIKYSFRNEEEAHRNGKRARAHIAAYKAEADGVAQEGDLYNYTLWG